ncbi:putative cupin superfamily sugar epimerase [Nakamurella sp. UYEF19]|uniref:cupin domain-containing protein n=1 Tax=Nakamurella sp. UYEF19 TaxID=1756392 RepID=UPI003394055D
MTPDYLVPTEHTEAEGRQVAARLGLEPLDHEGGLFRRTLTRDGVTAIYYLLVGNDFSAMHRMRSSDELFLFHAGAPLQMLILDTDEGREELLGPDPLSDHRPQLLVPAGVWQGARSTGAWSLVSTVVVPGFVWADFELGARAELSQTFPARAQRIAALTR